MKLCWLVPDDRGGGVISVAISCVREARAAGHDAVILLMLKPTGWLAGVTGIRMASLGLAAPATETPQVLAQWLAENHQDVLLLNGAEQSAPIIAYLPNTVRCIYVVHDTARRYWRAAIEAEADLDGIVAVSQTVANKFVHLLKKRDKLRVIHNGSMFPSAPDPDVTRANDLVFLGGSALPKGAGDVLELWPKLLSAGFTGRLHWFGNVEPAFEKRIGKLRQSERILLRGRTQRATIFAAAGESKLQLMLSRVESFGMSTLECMAMGCVPVAWDIPIGTKEIVSVETGFFVPLGDSTALAHTVVQACAAHTRLAPLVTSRARQMFGEGIMWGRYFHLLEDLLQLPPINRSHAGQVPPDYTPAKRRFQLLPASVRSMLREIVGRSPRLGYLLRDFRGL